MSEQVCMHGLDLLVECPDCEQLSRDKGISDRARFVKPGTVLMNDDVRKVERAILAQHVRFEVSRIVWFTLAGKLPEGAEPGPGRGYERSEYAQDLQDRLLDFLKANRIVAVVHGGVGLGYYEAGFFENDWEKVKAWLESQNVVLPEAYTYWKEQES